MDSKSNICFISIRKIVRDKLKAYCKKNGLSIIKFVNTILRDFINKERSK